MNKSYDDSQNHLLLLQWKRCTENMITVALSILSGYLVTQINCLWANLEHTIFMLGVKLLEPTILVKMQKTPQLQVNCCSFTDFFRFT